MYPKTRAQRLSREDILRWVGIVLYALVDLSLDVQDLDRAAGAIGAEYPGLGAWLGCMAKRKAAMPLRTPVANLLADLNQWLVELGTSSITWDASYLEQRFEEFYP